MRTNRDEPVSDYVRKRITEYRKAGGKLYLLARKAGVAKSMPSQVLSGVGVSTRSRAGFARAFDMSEDELMSKAWEWWLLEGRATAAAMPKPDASSADDTPQRTSAITDILGLHQCTEAEMRAILAQYAGPSFRDRDRAWWETTLLNEIHWLRRRALSEAAEVKSQSARHRRHRETEKWAAEQKAKAAAKPKHNRQAS